MVWDIVLQVHVLNRCIQDGIIGNWWNLRRWDLVECPNVIKGMSLEGLMGCSYFLSLAPDSGLIAFLWLTLPDFLSFPEAHRTPRNMNQIKSFFLCKFPAFGIWHSNETVTRTLLEPKVFCMKKFLMINPISFWNRILLCSSGCPPSPSVLTYRLLGF